MAIWGLSRGAPTASHACFARWLCCSCSPATPALLTRALAHAVHALGAAKAAGATVCRMGSNGRGWGWGLKGGVGGWKGRAEERCCSSAEGRVRK